MRDINFDDGEKQVHVDNMYYSSCVPPGISIYMYM